MNDVAINLFPFVQSSYLSLGQCMIKILQGNEKGKKKRETIIEEENY